MALADYTSYDDVRAALGVSEDELSDATLSLDLYGFNLVSELEEIDDELISTYTALKERDQATWSSDEVRLHQYMRLFSTYAVAKQATVGLPMFSPKEQTDGKAGLVRFAQNPYKDTIKSIGEKYDLFKSKLASAYSSINTAVGSVSVSRPYFSVVSPSTDPVTNS